MKNVLDLQSPVTTLHSVADTPLVSTTSVACTAEQ